MRSTRGAALLTAATLALTAVAGCGEEGDPTESTTTASPRDKSSNSPTESPTGSSSTSPGTSESSSGRATAQLPEAATKRTKAGAIAFNEFYQLQMGEALKTGSTQTLKRYSQGCEVCDTYRQRIEQRTASGTKMDRNPNSVRDVSATRRSDSGYKVTLTVDADEYYEVLADGSKGRSADAVTYTLTTDTQWHDNHWVIRDSVIIK